MGQTTRKTGEGFKEKLKGLKAHVVALQKQAGGLKDRAGRLGATGRRKRYAAVERSRCTGCGVCMENCPQGAINPATAAATPAAGPQNA